MLIVVGVALIIVKFLLAGLFVLAKKLTGWPRPTAIQLLLYMREVVREEKLTSPSIRLIESLQMTGPVAIAGSQVSHLQLLNDSVDSARPLRAAGWSSAATRWQVTRHQRPASVCSTIFSAHTSIAPWHGCLPNATWRCLAAY